MKYARLQVDPDDVPDDDKPPQTGHTFNIWYLQWAGGDRSLRNSVKSKYRVNIAEDSGETQAKRRQVPLFAQATEGDRQRHPTKDCFGRDKTADYKDDMSGVGSFNKVNRTLFVSGLHVNDDLDEQLSTHFGEFGSVDSIRVLPSKMCAFVRFKFESEAQFAKEAMDCQSLNGNDVLSVRWANEDPNPNAQQSAKRDIENAALETVKKLLKEEPRAKKPKKSAPKTESFKKAVSEEKQDKQLDAVKDSQEVVDEDEQSTLLGSARLAALNRLSSETKGKDSPIRAEIADKENAAQQVSQNTSNAFFAGYGSSEED
ncbi:hypothetical protein CJI97_001837 [Candidozyma auris]|nr:hypothetical protein CJI97_001837 [[Candida] auris]